MDPKKASHVDLERGKTLNLLIGLLVALSILFAALQFRSFPEKLDFTQALSISDLEQTMLIDDIEAQRPDEPEPPKQPEQKVEEMQLPDEFEVVPDETEVAKVSLVSSDQERPAPPAAPVGPAPVEEETEEIFEVVEEAPEFPGGMEKLYKYLGENIRYPEIAQENGIQGRVYVQFVVERDGSPTQLVIVRGVDASLDKEAMRVIKGMPKWKPGKQRGKPVRTKFTLPVHFRLQ